MELGSQKTVGGIQLKRNQLDSIKKINILMK